MYLRKYIVDIYNRKYKVFANDNIRYRNKQRIIRNYKIKEIKKFYSYRKNKRKIIENINKLYSKNKRKIIHNRNKYSIKIIKNRNKIHCFVKGIAY